MGGYRLVDKVTFEQRLSGSAEVSPVHPGRRALSWEKGLGRCPEIGVRLAILWNCRGIGLSSEGRERIWREEVFTTRDRL